ncbi:unnamed protein product [Lactuca saligna]|uniref:Uncharacterized protein n=1 Tax=Lactuca saligna TaxID=75948 RepID=A0AA35YCX5_LACSI|nr:unnamed protein product [Lactuca saligna]
MVVIVSTPSHLEISEAGRVKVDLQKEIVVADIPYDDATTDDQPIPDVSDQSKTDDYERFLDMGFMPQVVIPVVPLNVVYFDSYFEWEIPQGTNSDIESNNDQLNPRKRKDSFSGGAHDAEVGSPSIGIIVDEVREIVIENNVVIQERKETRKGEHLYAKLDQDFTSANDSVDVRSTNDQVNKIQLFNNSVHKQYRFLELNHGINKKKLGDALTRRPKHDPII